MALLTTITDAAWPTSGTPTAGNTGFESCASTGTLAFGVDENGDKFITTTATNEKIYIRVDGTAAVFASGETRYHVELTVYAELTGISGDPTIGSPSGFMVDLDGVGGRGLVTLYAANYTATTGLYGIFGAFNGASVGNQISGMDRECIPVGHKVTLGIFGDRTAGIAGLTVNGVRWGTWTATPASNNWGNSFTYALPSIPGVRWRVYATSTEPARSWTGTSHTITPTEAYAQYAEDDDELVMSWPHIATDGLHGSLWTYSGTCALTDYASGGVNPSRKRMIGGSGGVVATSTLSVGALPFNEYGDMAFITAFYVPSGTYSIAFRNAADTANVLKLTVTSGELRNTAGTALTASDGTAIVVSTSKRYFLAVNFTRTGTASFTLMNATDNPTARMVYSNTVATTEAATTLGPIVITATENVEADRVDICRWWTNGICNSLVSAPVNGLSPAMACCSNNIALVMPQRDTLAIPGIAHGCRDQGWPRDTWLATSAKSGYTRAAWGSYSRDHMTHTHAMKLVAVDGGCINDLNGGATAASIMDMVAEDVAFCVSNRNRIVLMPSLTRPHALASSLSTSEFLQQQEYNDLLYAYWLENNTNPRIGYCDLSRTHPQAITTTDGIHPTTTSSTNIAVAFAMAFEGAIASTTTNTPNTRYIGQFAPGATLHIQFRSYDTVDLSETGYTVTVYRNSDDTGEEATIGTATAAILPATYTLSGDYDNTDTGIIELTDIVGDVVAVQTFSVMTRTAGGGGSVTIPTNATYSGAINNVTGNVDIYQHMEYSETFDIEDYTGSTEDGDSLSIQFINIRTYNDRTLSSYPAVLTKTASASLTDGTLSLPLDLTTTDTASLSAGANGDGSSTYRLQIINTTKDAMLLDKIATVRRANG